MPTPDTLMAERDWEDLRRALRDRRADVENGNTRASRSAVEQEKFDRANATIGRLKPCAVTHSQMRYSRLLTELDAEWE